MPGKPAIKHCSCRHALSCRIFQQMGPELAILLVAINHDINSCIYVIAVFSN